MENNIFKEKQSFWTWWLCLLFLVLLGIEIKDSYDYFVESNHWNITTGFWIIIIMSIVLLFVRLKTKIDKEGVTISFIPFVIKKRILWTDISDIYIREYSITDFGGWGYRISKQGVAYNTKGKYGIQLVLKDGKRIMIGTQLPSQVQQIIQTIKNEHS